MTISENAKNLIQSILVLDPSKRPTLDGILNDPFMTSEPIPRTMPRSTLACPPPTNLKEQTRNSEQRGAQFRESEADKKISRNDSGERGFGAKNNQKDNFGATSSAFRPSSKEKGQQSTKNLSSNTNNFNTLAKKGKEEEEKARASSHNEVHVKKWVDYSTKYGLGYLLSDGSTGVYFNDSTKIILDKDGDNFEYIEKKPGERIDSISKYTIKEYPQERELQKKVTLLQHFRNYLYADTNKNDLNSEKDAAFCYVKKWMKTKHAIMFRLSNKIVQVNFTDRTEIILSSEQKLVTYINLKGERSEYPLATAIDSKNSEMAKRLKYTKEILTHMLNGTNVPQSSMGPGEEGNNPMGSSSKAFHRNWPHSMLYFQYHIYINGWRHHSQRYLTRDVLPKGRISTRKGNIFSQFFNSKKWQINKAALHFKPL